MTAPNLNLVCSRCYLRMVREGDWWKCRCGHRVEQPWEPQSAKTEAIAVAMASERMKGD